MPVELNSADILQNELHQNDFPVNFQEFQNINFPEHVESEMLSITSSFYVLFLDK